MLRIELAALSAQELRRLLDVARERNQDALAQQLMAELDTRPATRAEAWPERRVHASPVEVEDEPEDARSRRTGAMAATAALAAFVSAAVTWGLSTPSQAPQPAAAAPPAPGRAAVMLTSLAPVSAPPAPPPVAEPEPRPRVRMAKAGPPPRAESAKANPCYGLATAAERLVCGYPTLAAQDRELHAAYDRAKAAGADAKALDSAQTSWRIASDQVTDRTVLAELYARRIRELDTVAATAKAQDPPF